METSNIPRSQVAKEAVESLKNDSDFLAKQPRDTLMTIILVTSLEAKSENDAEKKVELETIAEMA